MFAVLRTAGGVGLAAVAAATYLANTMGDGKVNAAAPAAIAQRAAAPASEPRAMAPRRASGGAITLQARNGGHFFAPVEVNGHVVTMLVDTGASLVSLSAADARALGVTPSGSSKTVMMQTANGLAPATTARIPELRVDTILVRDVEAVISADGAQRESLLGMSFLRKLSSFNVSDGELTLKP
jgi:aspartyl protease family protein